MREERRAKNFAFFAEDVSTAIASETGDVYIFVPRRGFATSVGCHDCGYSFQCKKCERALIYHDDTRTLRCHYCSIAEPMTLSCPRCHSVVVDMRGGGTELVEKTIQMLLSQQNTHEIIRIDGDTEEINISSSIKPKIIIGTQRAIPLVDWDNTNLIILTGLDDILGLPELHATENVWYNTLDVLYHRKESSQIYIQTYHTEHVVFKSFTEPDRLYRTELNIRKQFSYPPYSDQLIRYIVSATDIQTAEKLGIELRHELEQKLTISNFFAKIDGPISMSPTIYRGLYRFVLIGKYTGADWQHTLSTLHRSLVTPCTIDPNPITLLSP
jgi:primosomal protein N' (replication factor Y)